MIFFNDTELKRIMLDKSLKQVSFNGSTVWKRGSVVTYYINDTTYYQEEVDSDKTCLEPTTFTPTMDGWDFVGWREDTVPSGEILDSKVMDNDPVTLYAVFSQNVTLSYKVNGSTSTNTDERYYNNGNIADPAFTINNPSVSGATFNGWSTNASSSDIAYSNISGLVLSTDLTVYAVVTYTDVTKSIDSGNGAAQSFTIYIDNTKYSKITLTSSSSNGMCSSRLYNSTGTLLLDCNANSGLTKSLTSFISDTYTVTAASNYAYASTTATITLTGKTVVG